MTEPPRLFPRPGADPDSHIAWWAFDISAARALTGAAAETFLGSVTIADVDPNTVHLVGPYAGRRQMIGQPLTTYHPPESWPAIAEMLETAIHTPPIYAPIGRAVTSLAFDDCVIRLSADPAHPDILFLAVDGIVTDQRSFWTVRASEQRYRNLIHYLPSALLQLDSLPMRAIFDDMRAKGVTDAIRYLDENPEIAAYAPSVVLVTDANRNAVQLFGVTGPEQLIGTAAFLFAASPDSAKRVIAAHYDGQRNYIEIMKLRTFDGQIRDVQLSVTYPTLPDRLDVTIFGLEDVTERLRTEAQLRQLQADYSRAARISMLGELATSIAHEVNQPLSAIVTNAETSLRWLSREDPNLAKVGQLTTRVAENARRASDIVQRIRGMAARREPERVPASLNDIVEEALLFVRHEIEMRAIALSVRLANGLPQVLADRVQLQQVIVNLLVNAVQAQNGAPGGRIEICTAAGAGNTVVFTIHDSGPGIAQENLERVFGSFFTTKDDGIGIGLALCQSIIAAHDGTISVANHPDGGALFQFSLPAAG